MAGKTAFLEKALLNGMLRGLATTAAAGSSGTSLKVTSSTGYQPGDLILIASATPANFVGWVSAVPDGTTITLAYAPTTTPTSGAVTRIGYSPTAIHVGLFTSLPSDAGGGTEASGGNYARQQVTKVDASWAAPSGTPSSTSNSSAIAWPAATWTGTVVGWGIFDASSTGNLIAWFDSTDKTVATNDIVQFAAAALGWSED
jgi:hypothetical protein